MIRSQMIASRTEVVAENGVVAGGHELEAQAGVRVMQEGGNAVDALVAAAFMGFVVEPGSCGIGGYGRLSIFLEERQEFITIDHYVRAPLKAHRHMFELDTDTPWHYYGHPKTKGLQAEEGYLSPAVPGAVAGLCQAHDLFGKLPLAQVLAPAIEVAEAGLPVSWELAQSIAQLRLDREKYRHLADFLLPNGQIPHFNSPWSAAERLDTRDLANTLRLIAQNGAAGFYSGPIAEAIEREVTAHGGILSAADLAAYRPKLMREKPADYRNRAYTTAYDQVGYETLNILAHFDLAGFGPDSVAYRHLVAEALGHAFMDNKVHYGDPEFVSSPVNGLTSPAFAAARAAQIRLDQAATRPIAAGNPWPFEDTALAPDMLPASPTIANIAGTSQMATADKEGNFCALITSISSSFGCRVMVPGTGIILNNSMQNFDPRPEHPNCIQPGKMPIFAAPSLVAAQNGRGQFAAGGSGGYRIMTGVLHTFLNAVDHGMGIQAAIDAPRVHNQGQETIVDRRIPAHIRQRLAAMGHDIVVAEDNPGSTNFGRIAAVWRDHHSGLFHAGTGPAWRSAAAGY